MIANYVVFAVFVVTLRVLMVKSMLRRKRKFYYTAPEGTHRNGSSEGEEEQGSKILIPVKTLVILGSGGHTTEMFRLLKHITDDRYKPIVFVLAETDYQSMSKINAYKRQRERPHRSISESGEEGGEKSTSDSLPAQNLDNRSQDENFKVHKIPRTREVNQAWVRCIVPALKAFYHSLGLIWREKPDLVLANGPGTCVPMCLAALFYQLIGLFKLPTIAYVESVCRTETLSLSGKILYYVSDLFFVQWDTLKEKYPGSIYLGKLI